MVYAVAIILISALTTVGLIAVWAATSLGNWFWRTMAFLGAMSPLLLIPAYEPFVAFVIQGAVVAGGVKIARWRANRKTGEPFLRSRFSLKTILLAIVPAALLVAVAVRLPALNFLAWQSVLLIGLGSGAATLAAWWILYGQSSNRRVRGLLALLMVSAVSLALACGDYFIYSVDGIAGWPPEPAAMGIINLFGTYADNAPVLMWTPILLTVMVLLVISVSILLARRNGIPAGHLKILGHVFGVVVFSLSVVPAAFIYLSLMNPLPIPGASIPNPNGYDDFRAAGKMLPASLLVNSSSFDAETATEQELQQASDEIEETLDRVRQGLEKPVMINLDYTSQEPPLPEISNLRTMARGFAAQGRLLLKQDQPVHAAGVFLDGARYGVVLSRGGLMVDDLVGVACTGVACRGLYASSKRLPAEHIPHVIAAIEKLEFERDPAEDVVYRDRVWSQRACGWYGHLLDICSQYFDNGWDTSEGYVLARKRELTTLRLLQLELALRLYEHDHGRHPESLDALVPEYIEAVPVDPMAASGELLRYAKSATGIVPYSVGMNGIDDQGQADEDDPTFGDLRLDVLFAPEPAASLTATPTPDEDDETEMDPDEEN
jgi:hypothetical protein